MKNFLSGLLSLSLMIGIQIFVRFSNASAQSSQNQPSGNEFIQSESGDFSDSQLNLLWEAYNTKSDSLLAKFFNNWRLETQIVEEPMLDTPADNSIASLYLYLFDLDFQDSGYPYKYAMIQNEIDATVETSTSSSPEDHTLYNFHPQSSIPNHPILIMLDDKRSEMLGEFLGEWSVAKAEAAQQFFGKYVPIGADVDYSTKQADWSLIRHWYSFAFTSDLQEAFVSDETPSGTDEYTCIIGQDGNWVKVSNQNIVLEPTPSPEPAVVGVPVPYPVPAPYPPHHPHFPPPYVHPVAPPVTVSPAPLPISAPPVGRPRPVSPPIHQPAPSNPIDIGRPRPIPPPQHNPTFPQVPAQPVRPRPTSPPTPQPPVERPRVTQPTQNNPPRTNPTPPTVNPPRSSPPPEKKTEEPRKR